MFRYKTRVNVTECFKNDVKPLCRLEQPQSGSLKVTPYPGNTYSKCIMEEQKASKVTLYLPPDLHRQLKNTFRR